MPKPFVSLAESFPSLALEANGWDPKTVTSGSNKTLSWKCKFGHVWETRVAHRTRSGSNCPVCSGNVVLSGFNDLKTTHPELSLEAEGWNPQEFSAGSGIRKAWKCAQGHVWEAIIKSRAKNGRGCPKCANKKVDSGRNDFATKRPSLAGEAHGWNPEAVVSGSNKKLTWKCPLGHLYLMSPINRMKGQGCPVCAGKEILPGFNDLASKYPEIAKEAYGWDTTLFAPSANRKMKWICKLGHVYEMKIGNRTLLHQNCPVCSNQKVLAGFNDLATIHPVVAATADGWDPTLVLPFSHKKMKWRCEQEHTWIASISARSAGQGCPTCADSGFDINSPAYIYLMMHNHWGLQKIGISNRRTGRTDLHKSRGWELIDVQGPMDGLIAYEWEQSILTLLRISDVDLANSEIAGRFDGYTECWNANKLKIDSIKELRTLVQNFESNHLNK